MDVGPYAYGLNEIELEREKSREIEGEGEREMDIWKLEARYGISGCGRDREIEGTETKLTTPRYSVGVTQNHPGWHS